MGQSIVIGMPYRGFVLHISIPKGLSLIHPGEIPGFNQKKRFLILVFFYSNIENLALWARSEFRGFAI